MISLRMAVKKLVDLGDAPSVARFLIEGDYKGKRRWDIDCPVSRYLTAATGRQVSVGRKSAAYTRRSEFAAPVEYAGTCVEKFIVAHDGGAYDELTV